MRGKFILVLGLLVATPALSQVGDNAKDKSSQTKVVKTSIAGEANTYEGSQFREQVNSVIDKHLGVAEGYAAIAPVLAYCDAKVADRSKLHFSVQNDDELHELQGLHPGKTIEWLDWSCPGAYTSAAYLAVEAGDASKALAFLDQAEAIAPLLADPLVERGYLQTRLGDPAAGVATYRRALALIDTHPGSLSHKAIALRGLGFSLVETGDLAGAREAYEQSLLVEPGNKLALDELDYVRDLEAAAAKPPAGSTPSP